VGLDAYPAYIEESRAKGTHDDYIMGDMMTVDIPDHSFDAVIAFHVIEHVTREDGLRLIKSMERWARRTVIIATPNGFVPTLACHKRGIADLDHLQEHKSGWTVDDFVSLGYRVRGQHGLKWFSGDGSIKKFFYYLSSPIAYFSPRLAFSIVAFKDVRSDTL